MRRAASRLGSRWPSFSRGVGNRSIERLVRDTRADVAILHLPHLVHLGRLIAPTTPIVYVLEEAWEKVHQAELVEPTPVQQVGLLLDRWRTDRLYRFAGRSAALLTAISEAEAEHFRSLTGRADIAVVPHGVDTTYFHPSDRAKTSDVVIVGDMRQRRNHLPTVDLLRIAEGRNVPFTWDIVGPTKGEPRPSPQVRWHGFVPDVRPFYWSSRVAVVTQTEGTGVKGTLLQAWASGVPVVASAHSARSAGATDDDDVLVADSPAAALDCVQRLLQDEPTARRLVSNGLERARALDIQRIADRFAADVHRLIR